MKKRHFTAICLLMAGVLFFNSMSVFATENAEAINDVTQETDEERYVITGFDEIEENCLVLDERASLDELLAMMPETIVAELDGEERAEISVTWESTDDYEETNYDFYEFMPCWDEEVYELSESLDSYWDVPCMQVIVPMEMTEEEQAYIREAKEALLSVLEEESVQALVYLCESYELKKEADASGESVCQVATGTTVDIIGVEIDANRKIWYQVSYVSENGTVTGYVEREYLAYSNEVFMEWEQEYLGSYLAAMVATFGISYADVEQFPESYQDKLIELKRKHPN